MMMMIVSRNSGGNSIGHRRARARHFYKWPGTGAPWV